MRRKSNISFLRHGWFAALALVGVLLGSCTGTKFLKEGEKFYDGAEIEFDTHGKRVGRRKTLRKELDTYINPKPNGKFLGNRVGVWFYYIAGQPKKKKGLRSFIKNKLGSPPVLMKDVNAERTAKTLNGQLFNEGYFDAHVTPEVREKKKTGTVVYKIDLPRPYRLRTITYPQPKDSAIARIVRTVKKESLLKERQRYDLERMQAELERIEIALENEGFYYFDDRHLIFEADTTVGKRRVDLDLKLEPGIPERARKRYTLGDVIIDPNFTFGGDSTRRNPARIPLQNGHVYLDYGDNKFRPEIISRVINLTKDSLYSRSAQDLTLSHLMGLGVFKFVNIRFRPERDSSILASRVQLTPLKKKSLRGEVQGVSKSNNFVGPGVQLTFTNRNFLRGAELFQLKFSAAYEVQVSRKIQNPLNSLEFGLESSLTVPRFITPVRINYNSRKYLPKTIFKAAYNLQNRVGYFRLNSFNVAAGYNWSETASRSHELYPIDITFVRTDKRSAAFDSTLVDNPVLAKSFENQFIIGTRYSFTYNSQMAENLLMKFEEKKYQTHNFYFNANVDVAGNLVHAIQRITNPAEEGKYEIFNLPYSQYVKGDVDLRYYWQPNEHSKLATRLILGAGYAFNDSSATLPYIKQFAIGGSNSLRAFPARSVGPGTFNVREHNAQTGQTTQFIDQRADIKLEGNIEYRFDIIKMVKGAVFVDAGNIWLWREDPARPGGEIVWGKIFNQLAVGTGVGLRFDFSYFVLRLDTAFPLRQPSGWVTKNIDFGSSDWRGDNLIFNIAFGYPF